MEMKVRSEVRRNAGPSATRATAARFGRDDVHFSELWADFSKRSNEESEHIHYGMHAEQQQGRGSREVNLKCDPRTGDRQNRTTNCSTALEFAEVAGSPVRSDCF